MKKITEIKLEYIPEKVYTVFQNNIIEYTNNNSSDIKFKNPMFDNYKNISFDCTTPNKTYPCYNRVCVGTFRSKDNSFTLLSDFFITKKEAYDAYVKELENQIKELNDRAFKLQMEALDIIGDVNIFMEQYKDLEENEKEIKL